MDKSLVGMFVYIFICIHTRTIEYCSAKKRRKFCQFQQHWWTWRALCLVKCAEMCWNSNTLARWCEELTHWKRPWCWERLRTGGKGDNRGDGWMASSIQWTWVWVDSGSWWWTGRLGVLWFMGLQGVWHDWVAELNWNVRERQILYY